MGRSKVPADSRRRVVSACHLCKSSKRRCDGRQPCSRCVRQKRQQDCHYDTMQSRHESQRRTSATAEPTLSQPIQPVIRASSAAKTNETLPIDTSTGVSPTWSNVPRTPAVTSNSRMMRGVRGEKVYVGPSAALSFLQLLRDTFASRSGTWYAEREGETEALLDVEFTSQDSEDFACLKDQKQLNDYVLSFSAVTSGVLDVFSETELLEKARILAETGSLEMDKLSAPIYLAIAIGAQCRSQSNLDLRYAKSYFAASEPASHDAFLAPSISSITNSLLAAFYMLATSRKNASYMHIGVAARAAYTLGLHQKSSYMNVGEAEVSFRSRLWKSICVLDIMICSILGRPPAAQITNNVYQLSWPGETPQAELRSMALDFAFRAVEIISDTLSKVYTTADANPRDAQQILHRLTEWRNSLPYQLKRTVDVSDAQAFQTQTTNAASIQVACLYYYSVILVCRPFLVRRLESAERRNSREAAECEDSIHDESLEIEQLSEASIDAAIYMIETIYHAVDGAALFSNVCFIRTWLFSAALVLAFAMIVAPQTTFKSQRAFDLAKTCFLSQSQHSLYASQYHRILQDISVIIARRHEQLAQQQRDTSGATVQRILSFPDAVADSQFLTSADLDASVTSFPGVVSQFDDANMGSSGWNETIAQLEDIFSFDFETCLP